ncbi:MAG: hypothetical protein QXE96_02795 [Candidatus Caldarchaeum sp.]|jgi:DNA replication factor GINS
MEEVYEKLLELWGRERSEPSLQKIDEIFLDTLANYMGMLRRQVRLSERDSLNASLKSAELQMLGKLLESVLSIRFRKISEAAMRQEQLENLLPFEKKTMEHIMRALSFHEAKVRNGVHNPRTLYAEEDEKLEVVVFLRDFPKFVGEDLVSYGPFKEGDLATIYHANAVALAQKKVVRLMKLI